MAIITIAVTTAVGRVAAEVTEVAVEVQVETITEAEGVTIVIYGEDNFFYWQKQFSQCTSFSSFKFPFPIGSEGSM